MYLEVLVATGPLAKARGADVLVRGELIFLHDHLEGGDGGDDGTDGFRLAPVGVAAALCHGFCSSLFRRLGAATVHFTTYSEVADEGGREGFRV